MKIQCGILIVFFLTTSIKYQKAFELPSISIQQIITKDIMLTSETSTDSILIEQRTKHYFSLNGEKDEFYIRINGQSVLEGKAVFTITSFEGNEIFREEFPSKYLIGYDLPPGFDAPIEEQEKYIKKRVVEFFDEKNFKAQAIETDEIFTEEYSEKEIWDDIKNDKDAVGFYFLIGEGDGRSIAYSKKTKKVVLYFNCC